MRAAVGVIVVAGLLSPHGAHADEPSPPRHAVQLAASGLYARATTSKGDTSGVFSERNGGAAVALRVAYRSPYVVGAFADYGLFPLYRSDRHVDLGSAGGRATTLASLSTTGLTFGVTADVWRLRASAGVGSFSVAVRSTTLGVTNRVSEGDIGYVLSLAGFPVRWRRLEIGVEARAIFVVEAELTAVCLGFTMGGDLFRW